MNKEFLYLLLFIILILFDLFFIIIPIFYLRYIHKMKKEKVECSEGFSRNFIQGYSIFGYIYIFVLTIMIMKYSMDSVNKVILTPTAFIISTGAGFLFGYYLYQYQKKVYRDCPEAVKSWEPKVMKVHSVMIGVIICLSIINIIAILNGNMSFQKSIIKSISKHKK